MTLWDKLRASFARVIESPTDTKKTFDIDVQQARAYDARVAMKDHYFQHFKGGHYRVHDVAISEGDGTLVVVYESVDAGPKMGYRWVRSYDDFIGMKNMQRRFTVMAGPPPAVRNATSTAAAEDTDAVELVPEAPPRAPVRS